MAHRQMADRNFPLDNPPDLLNNVKDMPKGENLGDLEQLVLTSLMILGENGYGMTVHEKAEELAAGERSVSLGSVYTTLDRLEQKGYVRSWFGGATEERGGRSKRYFEIQAAGQMALQRSLKVAGNMLTGLREIGGVI
jgi:PadR family transcriptional regulator PadR